MFNDFNMIALWISLDLSYHRTRCVLSDSENDHALTGPRAQNALHRTQIVDVRTYFS